MNEKQITKRKTALKQINDEVLDLKESPLYKFRVENKNFPVIGEGNNFAQIMLVGEAPGKKEATSGRPFRGAAGKILDELIRYIELNREDVYITNIVKDRPPENRDPTPNEIKIYSQFLDKQIEIIRPKIVAGLGRFSSKYLMEKFKLSSDIKVISEMHGKVFEAKAGYGKIKIVPLYHPAAAIYNQHLKETLKKDFRVLKKLV